MKARRSPHWNLPRPQATRLGLLCGLCLFGPGTLQLSAQGGANCTPSPSGLVDWWPGDGFAFDVAGTNNATLQDGASYGPGEVGLAFSFNGTNSFVQLPQNLFPFPTSGTSNAPFSFELWFSTTSGGVLLGQQNTVPSQTPSSFVPAIYIGTDLKLRVEMFWSGSVNVIATTTVVTDGNFHHLAVTYNGTNELVYIDSRLSGHIKHKIRI